MVKYIDKWKDDYEKKCGNGDEKLDVEVEGDETRAMGGIFGGYK